MRTFLLLVISITFFNQAYAQNWEFEGTTQFTDFASDAAITHNPAGETYIAYANVLDDQKVYVKKFNGTNWVDVGSVASAQSASLLAIAINPLDGNPWVAFKDTSTNLNLKIIKFDGTTWSLDGDLVFTTDFAPARKIQLDIDANGKAFVVSTNNGYGNQHLIFYSNISGTWNSQFLKIVTGNVELLNCSELYYNEGVYPGTTITYKRVLNGLSWENAVIVRNIGNVGTMAQSLSLATGTDYLIQRADNYGQIYHTENVSAIYNYTQVAPKSVGYFMNYKNNPINNRNYVFYLDEAYKGFLKVKGNSSWNLQTSPAIDLSALSSSQYAKMVINPLNGKIYIAYNDAGKVSVKYFSLPPTLNRIYVNENAVGNGNGSSWANAYTKLSEAINVGVGSTTTEIWIAQGTYTPSDTDKTTSFTFENPNLTVYGGFNGTETAVTQRDFRTNKTILSGDLLSNDNTDYTYVNSSRNDNTYNLVKINANNITLDGLTISSGHARASIYGSEHSGAGLTKLNSVTDMKVLNCIFEKNVCHENGAGILAIFEESGTLDIENCEFNNNVGKGGAAIYSFTEPNKTATIKISNSLFDNNKAANLNTNTSFMGYTGSAAWLRAYGTGSNIDATFTNNTFVNNVDMGTSNTISNRTTLALDQTSSSVMTAKIYNSIFWNNKDIGNATSKAIRNATGIFPNTLIVTNSLDSDNFSTVVVKQNIVTTDPLFISPTNFQLTATSPAVNTGDNSKVPTSTTQDLAGNTRIVNNTVDMGAYEYDAALSAIEFTSFLEFTIYPNPARSELYINSNEAIKSIAIYSLEGKLIINSQDKTIDVSDLQPGIYLVKIINSSNKMGVSKLVKK